MTATTPKHFLQISDFSLEEFEHLIARTRWIKDRFKRYEIYQPLRDRTLAMVFEKASTRTRVSFEAGMNQLGGIAINLNRSDTHLSRGEPIEDVARVISRMVDVVMIRTFEQSIIERFAAHSRVPVINGLTNEYHPCQILADIYTYIEHRGSIRGKTVAWIGDQQRLQHVAAGGGHFRLQRARVRPARLRDYRRARRSRGTGPFRIVCRSARGVPRRRPRHDRRLDEHGLRGGERCAQARFRALAGRREMMRQAKADALFMHCLPVHRGEEVAAEVIDGPQSVVWDEAENRLHAQKALLEYLVCGRVNP